MKTMKNIEKTIKKALCYWKFKDDINITAENIKYNTNNSPHIWTVNENYILKMTDNEFELKNNITISKILAKENIPVQKVITTIDGKNYISIEDKYFTLFTKIKGDVLKDYFQGDYLNRGFYLGQCLSALHKGLFNITDELKKTKKIDDNNMINELNGWVSEEITKHISNSKLSQNELYLFNGIYENMKENFENLYNKLPRQAIHRDMHGENMIFQDEKLVGYIDFDLSQINARIYDLCYLCTAALSTVFNDINKKSLWLEFAKNIIKGYESKTTLTNEEKLSIKYMFYLIELIMIAYFSQNGCLDIADTNIKMINWIDLNWDNASF